LESSRYAVILDYVNAHRGIHLAESVRFVGLFIPASAMPRGKCREGTGLLDDPRIRDAYLGGEKMSGI
jgi:hypothetical protein